MVRAALVTATSLALTGAVIAHAYLLKHQFYPTVVYLTKSSPSMAVLYIQAFVLVFLLGKFMRKVFFGQLRAAEMEHLIERSWYAVTETCLAFTVFRDDFSPRFVGLFTLLLFIKCFHWLAEDRVDFMERSPNISWVFHFRVFSLMLLLGVLDFLFVNHACHSIITRGASVQLVFGFEYAILMTMVFTTFIKYTLHTVDLQSDNPWDNKAVYMLYTELFTGFIKVLLYMAFMTIMIKVHTFPLFAIRPMYLAMRQFKKAVTDAIMSRRAIRNMNTLYPDATPEDLLASDNVCIICREEMVTGAKKLPCNHIFHARYFMDTYYTIPVLDRTVSESRKYNVGPGMMPHFPPGLFPFWGPFPGAAPPAGAAGAPGATETPGATEAAQTQGAGELSSMPPPPPALSTMSEAELRELEQEGRRGLEARLQCLHNIHTLLDAAMLNIDQYLTTVATLIPPQSETSSAAGEASGSSPPSTTAEPEAVNGATGFSQPDSTTLGDSEDQGDGEEVGEDGEPNPSELRRRRLRKLETTPPPPDH
uniref:Synovial apoptosis inhibitor 1, synoviolin n=1 Tax=Oncorhynchus kisutch TaxID=8019 RepID=A0A8C7JYR0_ONCKI